MVHSSAGVQEGAGSRGTASHVGIARDLAGGVEALGAAFGPTQGTQVCQCARGLKKCVDDTSSHACVARDLPAAVYG